MPNRPRRVEILSFPDVQLLDVAGPLQVFVTANEIEEHAGRARPYDAVVVAKAREVMTSAGLALATRPLASLRGGPDTLIVAGGWGVSRMMADKALIGWIGKRSRLARRTASVCSGAFLLAEAGLLDHRRAVTHWQRCAEFERRFPKVRLEPDPIFLRDGDIWTSAGITAGIDLALSFVEDDLGRRTALAVARQLVVFLKRPGGQSQFSAALAGQEGDDRFERLHLWMMENLRGDLSLPVLAAKANMSPRSFSRHYLEATRRTPARAVEHLRVEAARRLLEERVPVAQAARRCGFGSEETMRRSFLRLLAVGPQAYRERF